MSYIFKDSVTEVLGVVATEALPEEVEVPAAPAALPIDTVDLTVAATEACMVAVSSRATVAATVGATGTEAAAGVVVTAMVPGVASAPGMCQSAAATAALVALQGLEMAVGKNSRNPLQVQYSHRFLTSLMKCHSTS